jgi:hypothetical protein
VPGAAGDLTAEVRQEVAGDLRHVGEGEESGEPDGQDAEGFPGAVDGVDGGPVEPDTPGPSRSHPCWTLARTSPATSCGRPTRAWRNGSSSEMRVVAVTAT